MGGNGLQSVEQDWNETVSPLPIHCDLMNQSGVTVAKVSGRAAAHVTCIVCAGISLNEF